ncbi:MAG: four-carbon acid sugar kinase family protein [Clostridia bacterium]|nr:four-carbon acid sugar kinase family protein [Clostridia bacterium]
MIRLMIIADDFTGGLDTGVQFAQKGIRTRVVTDWQTDYREAADGCEVLVIVAETRHIRPAEAYDIVSRIVRKSVSLNVPFIYKKTDSGLRGNIGAELSAALEASGASVLPFLPSMPALGRVTVGGIHTIGGVPVAESVFGKDPFEPVTESDVCRMIGMQSKVAALNGTPDQFPEGNGIWVIDATTDADLLAAGQRLCQDGRLRVMAGCAGFAAVLPDLLGLRREHAPELPPLAPGLLVLCGSVNPITQSQLDYAEKGGFTRVHILPEQKLEAGYFDSDAGQAALAAWRNQYETVPWFILDANDSDPANRQSAGYIESHGMDLEEARQCISGSLGRILPALLESPVNRSMLITGGDTLLQCMNRLQVSQMEPLLEVFPGVVLSVFETAGQMRYVITKSGGFGKETLLCDLRDLIAGQAR